MIAKPLPRKKKDRKNNPQVSIVIMASVDTVSPISLLIIIAEPDTPPATRLNGIINIADAKESISVPEMTKNKFFVMVFVFFIFKIKSTHILRILFVFIPIIYSGNVS